MLYVRKALLLEVDLIDRREPRAQKFVKRDGKEEWNECGSEHQHEVTLSPDKWHELFASPKNGEAQEALTIIHFKVTLGSSHMMTEPSMTKKLSQGPRAATYSLVPAALNRLTVNCGGGSESNLSGGLLYILTLKS